MIVIIVIPQALTKEVQAVQMVQSLNIRRVPAAILFVDLHLVGCQTRLLSQGGGDDERAVIYTERFPHCVDFWACGLAEDVLFEQGTVELC